MKRIIALLLTLLTLLSLFAVASCAARNSVAPSSSVSTAMGKTEMLEGGTSSYSYDIAPSAAPQAAPPAGTYPGEDGGYYNESAAADSLTAMPIAAAGGGDGFAEKIIYSVYAELESVDFDASVEKVYALLDVYGAFIESSYVGGRNYTQEYYGYQTYRTARFIIRVPSARLDEAKDGLDELGNVISVNSDAQNITAQFVDTESRLATYRTEEERLLAMLAKADTVADMITIEQRLSEVRYNIESLTSTLKNWQNQVDYSTMTLAIQEVEKLSEITPIQRSYWHQIGDGIKSTVKNLGEFFKGVFKWVAVQSPVLAILAVIVLAGLIVARKKLRKTEKSKLRKDDSSEE